MSRRQVLIVLILLASTVLAGVLLRTAPAVEPAVVGSDTLPAALVPQAEAHPIVLGEAEELLRSGRPWRAAQRMRDHLERHADAPAAAVLLAARAEAGWGGWDRVRALLDGRPWLAEAAESEGLYLLARALEADTSWAAAEAAYRRFLEVRGSGDEALRPIAELRLGLVALRTGGARDVELPRALRESAPALAPWVALLSAEALASRGDTAAVRARVTGLDEETFGRRARRAVVAAYGASGDAAGLRRVAGGYRRAASAAAERAEFALEEARAAIRLGDRDGAREALRVAVAAPAAGAARDAADELESLGGLTAADRLAIAQVRARHGQHPRAADGFRAWLATGSGTAAERHDARLSLGRSLFAAGAFAEAEEALRPLSDAPAAVASQAIYLAGRAQYAAGRHDAARQTYLRVAQLFPRTQPGAEALYLVADMYHGAQNVTRARPVYRRVADEFPGIDRAGLALMRLAGIAYLENDYAAATRFWEEYRTSYPRGQLWLQATYWAGRALEAAGDRDGAAARYREVRGRDPMSYYALLAAERLGQSYWPVPMGAEPAIDPAAARRVEGSMRAVDLLRDAGLHDEADAEIARLMRAAGSDAQSLYPLAEALNARGYTVQGIRLGLQLQGREGTPNPRLLRILYPFPYRTVIEAEAHELGLDPLVSAALIRQESMFSARISSPVGARGLMQIMPATGRAVAENLGIARWHEDLLFQPEINVHLGTRYLADQVRAYDGSLPSVFSAYNAGPHRIDSWREYPEYGNEELFTERIPFRETRDYVKILTRNIAIYQGLYGK